MLISVTSGLIRAARREGYEAAADIVQRESDKLLRLANKHRNAPEPDYDTYEELEGESITLQRLADKIRRKAKRDR